MATTAWFVVFPASEHPGNAFPANAKIVSAQTGSAAYNAWLGNGAYTIAGTNWQVDAGPFTTQQQAQAWSPHALGITDWVAAGIAGVMVGAGGASPSAAIGTGSAIANTLGGFNISNWFLRIGEILLGLVLIGVGVARITGAQNAISNIVKTKMPIPI
jgi:hypothetical protein